MRNVDTTRARARGGAAPRTLALLLGGTALCLAFENAVLLFVVGPALNWPAELASLALALRVARVLVEAFAPYVALGLGAALAGAAMAWAALRIRSEVNHA